MEPSLRNEVLIRLIVTTDCKVSEALRINRGDIAWHQYWAEIVLTGRIGKLRRCRIEGVTFEVFRRMCAENDQSVDYVFQTCHGRLGRHYAHQLIKEAAERAGYPKVNSERLRRSTIIHRQMRGESLRQIAESAGITLGAAVKYIV